MRRIHAKIDDRAADVSIVTGANARKNRPLGELCGSYASMAVRRYADSASDEWTTLIGQMGRAEDPGAICLKRAFAQATQR